MTEKRMLIGSLSNDLYRVANLIQKGSYGAADRFLLESKKWTNKLKDYELRGYIKKIIKDLNSKDSNTISMENAEKLLMYSILLQNYSLHLEEFTRSDLVKKAN